VPITTAQRERPRKKWKEEQTLDLFGSSEAEHIPTEAPSCEQTRLHESSEETAHNARQIDHPVGKDKAVDGRPLYGGASLQWRSISLDAIDLHPLLKPLYQSLGFVYPPEFPKGYLSPRGVLAMARHLPIHLVPYGKRWLCFAGVRLLEAARGVLPADSRIETLIHPAVDESGISEAIELEQDLLYIWHRQDPKQRDALDDRYLRRRMSVRSVNLVFNQPTLKSLEKLLKTSLRKVKDRWASIRTHQQHIA